MTTDDPNAPQTVTPQAVDGTAPQTTENQPAPENPETIDNSTPSAPEKPVRKGLATAAFVVAVIAWLLLPVLEWVSLGCGVAGLILSVLALRQRRGAWRNMALVALVSTAVLLLVLTIFWTALVILLK